MNISSVSSSPWLSSFTAPAQPSPAQASQQTAKKDTVAFSQQAQQLASDGDTAATEIKESAAEKATEALNKKK